MLSALTLAVVAMSPLPPPESGCSALHEAAWRGDLGTVRRLASRRLLGFLPPAQPLDVFDTGPRCCQRTPLMLAAEYGQQEVLLALLGNGANVAASASLPDFGELEVDARCLAIANDHPELVPLLERAGATDSACSSNARLLRAAAAGDPVGVKLELGSNPGAAVLLQALLRTVRGRAAPEAVLDRLVPWALATHVDFNEVFAAAVEDDKHAAVSRLVVDGAKLTGGDVLAKAIALNRYPMIKELRFAGAEAGTLAVRQALYQAMKNESALGLYALLESGWRGDERTPLLLWAMKLMRGSVEKLIELGVSVSVPDEANQTPLGYATQLQRKDWVRLLLDRGATPLELPEPTVPSADPEEERSWKEIVATATSHEAAVRKCFEIERQLDTGPVSKAPVLLSLVIEPEGNVSGVQPIITAVDQRRGYSVAATCLTSEVKRWQFPAHGVRAMSIVYPFSPPPARGK